MQCTTSFTLHVDMLCIKRFYCTDNVSNVWEWPIINACYDIRHNGTLFLLPIPVMVIYMDKFHDQVIIGKKTLVTVAIAMMSFCLIDN